MNIDGEESQRLKRSAQKSVNNDGGWRAHPQTVLWLCEDIEKLHGALREARSLVAELSDDLEAELLHKHIDHPVTNRTLAMDMDVVERARGFLEP